MPAQRLLLAMVGLCCVLGWAQPAWSGPSRKEQIEAQKLFREAAKLGKDSQWQEARAKLEASLQLHDLPKTRYQLANALSELGLLIEAREQAQQVVDHKRATWWDKKHAKALLKRIEERLPHLTVQVVEGFEGVVRLDDELLESGQYNVRREVNPGTVLVTAKAEGFQPFEKSVILNDAADDTVNVVLEPLPQPKKSDEGAEVSTNDGSTRKTLGYVSLAVGGAGLVVGTAFGFVARSTREDLRGACLNDVCSETQRENYDKGRTQANISTAGFIVGGVGVGLGAVLLLTGPSSKEKAAESAGVRPFLGPTSAGFEGRF